MPTANPVGWFEIYVADMDRAKAFYEKTLQVKLEKLPIPSPGPEMWAFPMHREGSGCAGSLIKLPEMKPGVGGTIIYFSCEDCSVEAGRAASNGGALAKPKFPIGQYGFVAYIKDTEGNLIGLHSMK